MAISALQRLADREQETIRDREARQAMWLFLWILFFFKIATVGVIWYAASASGTHDMAFIVATTWYWLLIPMAAITGPLLFRWRLLKVRRRRQQLRHAEWMDGPAPPAKPPGIARRASGINRH